MMKTFNESLLNSIEVFKSELEKPHHLIAEGQLTRIVGLTLEASGCRAPIGTECQLIIDDKKTLPAEVVGFSDDRIYLMPIDNVEGLSPGMRVIPTGRAAEVNVGHELLGRVLNGHGEPIDNKGPLLTMQRASITKKVINPLERQLIRKPLDVGVRSINSLLTIGRGQRIGLFSGSGVGKSVLLSMMTRFTEADVVVVALIGERGREVKEFIDKGLGEEGLSRAVVVASPADSPPLLRLHGSLVATSIAEYFRDQGLQVLLLMDSLTRFAQAQREISLAIGEPPATKGYTPSVFSKLSQLVERAGNTTEKGGAITAFYTVLAEGDDQQDPIADAARAILDGHIVLSRDLADAGHYPAIDIEASISRVMSDVTPEAQQIDIQRFKQLYSLYHKNQDLINVGAYAPGSNPAIDEAIALYPYFTDFLDQAMNQRSEYTDSVEALKAVLATPRVTDPNNAVMVKG